MSLPKNMKKVIAIIILMPQTCYFASSLCLYHAHFFNGGAAHAASAYRCLMGKRNQAGNQLEFRYYLVRNSQEYTSL